MEAGELDLPTLVSLLGGVVQRSLLRQLADEGFAGIRPSHGYVIQRLIEDEPTVTALAETLGMTQQGASKQVLELQSLGCVERFVDPTDQRVRRVRLSPKGWKVLEAGRRARRQMEMDVAAAVGEETIAAAKVALSAMMTVVGLDEQVRTRSVLMDE